MPELLVGPLLRYLSETEARIWVDVSEQREVQATIRLEPFEHSAEEHVP
jgi:hypothetical protein